MSRRSKAEVRADFERLAGSIAEKWNPTLNKVDLIGQARLHAAAIATIARETEAGEELMEIFADCLAVARIRRCHFERDSTSLADDLVRQMSPRSFVISRPRARRRR